jgi:hypothetical protein
MRRLAACIAIGLLASWHAAHAQTKPIVEDQKGPKDRTVSGVFSPDRVKSDQEALAKKAQDSGAAPLQRSRSYYFAWSSMTPAEFEALGRHVVFLISIWTQKPEELPVKRIYIRADGQELPLYKVASWKTPVDSASLTAKMYGPNREDGFYLVPGGAMLKKGQVVLDLANRTGWIMLELPSNVASNDARRFPNPNPEPNAKPDLKALQVFIQRKFPGFPVPQSLP